MTPYERDQQHQRELAKKPFAFADLPLNPQGKRIEPESWGPLYSRPPKPTRKVDVDRWPSNCASGQKGDFSAAKHRAKLKAEFDAGAATDKRNWAAGKLTIDRPGFSGNIVAAYDAAMAIKRNRLAIEACRAPKPHYVLRDGQWRVAA